MALPIPEAPPVTTAVLAVKRFSNMRRMLTRQGGRPKQRSEERI